MKAKKALKRLNKVEVLLTDVIDEFPGSKDGLAELLGSAKTAVVHAQKTVSSQLKKPPTPAKTARRGGLTPEGRKRISIAAKKRWAAAKRQGVNAVAGRRLGKTA
jgi:hypothetical protein